MLFSVHKGREKAQRIVSTAERKKKENRGHSSGEVEPEEKKGKRRKSFVP